MTPCPIEELGHYDPMCTDAKTQTVLNVSRVRYWLSVGAQPSHKVQVLLNKFGVKKPAPGEPWQVADDSRSPRPRRQRPAAGSRDRRT